MKVIYKTMFSFLLVIFLGACEKETTYNIYTNDFISPSEYELRTVNYYTNDSLILIYEYGSPYNISKLEFSFVRNGSEESTIHEFRTYWVNVEKKSGILTIPWKTPETPTPENHSERIVIEAFSSGELLYRKLQPLRPFTERE